MSFSTFDDSFDQLAGDSANAPNLPFDDGFPYPPLSSQPFDSFSNFADGSESPIYASESGLGSDPAEKPFDDAFPASDGPVLPPPTEMQEEGLVLREWRRQNALHLEEKEKREKAILNQIIDEADVYKVEFYKKRQIAMEANKATCREKEKIFLVNHEKFHAEADKHYWKAIAELIPNEVPAIEKKGKKDQDKKKPSIAVIQGPKPGKPTELSRMRQILLKLKHDTPPHLKNSPPPTKDANTAKPVAVA